MMAFLAVVYVFGKTFWGSVPVKASLRSKLCEWLRKQVTSTNDEPACSRLWGGWDARQGLRALQDLGTFSAQSWRD